MSEKLKRAAELLREQASKIKVAHIINGAWPTIDKADEHTTEAYRDYQALREASTDVEKAAAELSELSAKVADLKERNNEMLTERNRLSFDIQQVALTGRMPEGHRMARTLQLVAKLVDELGVANARIAELGSRSEVGARAVALLKKIENVLMDSLTIACPRCFQGGGKHSDDCELDAILRDANGHSAVDSSTVAVNREALEALRAALANYAAVHHWMCDKEREAGALNVISAANHLLDGGAE